VCIACILSIIASCSYFTPPRTQLQAPKACLSASCIQLSECQLLWTTEFIKILLTKCGYGIVKMVRDPRMTFQAAELQHEARIYRILMNAACADAVPEFFGFSDRYGVPLLCVAAEGDDFEDIGLENISSDLKHSAVAALERISECGILHGDLAMRNIVRSRHRHESAKFIDFGRAQTTKNTKLLDAQVIALKNMLGIGRDSASVDRREVGSRKVRPALTNRSPLAEL
jgi:tRNA A-37 threonylcarbamoyl transferase component Bud32